MLMGDDYTPSSGSDSGANVGGMNASTIDVLRADEIPLDDVSIEEEPSILLFFSLFCPNHFTSPL